MNGQTHLPSSPSHRSRIVRNTCAVGFGLLALAGGAKAQCTLSGDGSSTTPYLVGTYADLLQVGLTCGMSATYKVTADIDTTGQAGVPFQSIGTTPDTSATFAGRFLGQGHSIKNISFRDTLELNAGFFGSLSGSIDSLTLSNVNIFGKVNNVGGLVGFNAGTITGCYVTGVVNGSRNGIVGGVVGENNGTVLRSHSLVLTNSDTGSCVGGVVGANDTDGVVRACYSTGSLLSSVWNNTLGGVVGLNNGTVVSSYSAGRISGGATSYVGGVVGENAGTVDSCYSTSQSIRSLSGSQIGGVVGLNDSLAMVNASYSTNPVYGDYNSQVGGVVGVNNGAIRGSYSTDSVTGGTFSLVGGVAAQSGTSGNIRYCYSMGRLTGADSTSVGGVVGENSGVIQNSYGSDTIVARAYSRVGGIAATNEAQGAISDCYAVGRVMCSNGCSQGGLLGENRGVLLRAFAVTGMVHTDSLSVGGAVGMNGPGGVMRTVFWNSQVSQIDVGVGSDVEGGQNGVPNNLNSSLMRDSVNFRGFDFLNVWSITQGVTYPNLRNIVNSAIVPVEQRSHKPEFFASLRRVGGEVVLELSSASEVRVVDAQGRQILAPTSFKAGSRVMKLPKTVGMIMVQVKSERSTATLVAAGVR